MDYYRYRRYMQPSQESRWATEDEIKTSSTFIRLNEAHYPGAGLPLLSDGKQAWVDSGDTHSLIFGSTGSKKTRLFCMPMLNMFIRAGESFIATDPKGELYKRTSGMAKEYGYHTVVLNFRDIGKGDQWNPLSLPYDLYHSGKKDEAVTLLNDFVATLAASQMDRTKDVFWPEMASAYALAGLLLLMERADKEEANVSSMAVLCSESVVDDLKMITSEMSMESIAGMNFRNVLISPEKTLNSILVSLYAMIRIFNINKKLCTMLSDNTIDMSLIGREKTALYIIVPDEKTTLHFLVTTFIKQVNEILIQEAQKEKSGMLPIRVNYLLDEFCNIPKIPDMPSMISAGRSRNIRYFLVVQSKHQLMGRYGEDADTIKGNCDNWVFLTSKELDLLNEISELCGTITTAMNQTRRLISVSELQRLDKEKGEALIMHARKYPLITEIADIDMYDMFKGYAPMPMKKQTGVKFRLFDFSKFKMDIYTGKKPIPFLNGD